MSMKMKKSVKKIEYAKAAAEISMKMVDSIYIDSGSTALDMMKIFKR